MYRDVHHVAERLLHRSFDALTAREQEVVRRFAARCHISRDVHTTCADDLTLGQRVADRVATFGGSWTFILIFGGVLVCWIIVNGRLLAMRHQAFDPFPYILLNLVLSMLAALQAPVIMMSQNRQAIKDRETALHDYEVNLKAELEILALHEKLDALRSEHAGIMEELTRAIRAMAPASGESGA